MSWIGGSLKPMHCNECGAEIDDKCFCSNCGLSHESSKKNMSDVIEDIIVKRTMANASAFKKRQKKMIEIKKNHMRV